MCTVVPTPFSLVEPVVDVLHGVPVTDPYRWLEDQNSPRARAWIEEQTRYARSYLDGIPGRQRIAERVAELLDVETYDSFLVRQHRYFFRKRLVGREQPGIYFREGPDGEDQLLVDPGVRGTGAYTSARPLEVSADGRLLLYEVKQGGERAGTCEILDIVEQKVLPDALPHGILRGFAFAPDARSFYYALEATAAARPFYRAAYEHVLGTPFEADREIFSAGEDQNTRLILVAGRRQLGFLVYRYRGQTCTDFYITGMGDQKRAVPVLRDASYSFAPRFLGARILAYVDREAPNGRIVEVQPTKNPDPWLLTLVPERDAKIRSWALTANYIIVSYARGTRTEALAFDSFGRPVGQIPSEDAETVKIAFSSTEVDKIILERQSYLAPIAIDCYALSSATRMPWAQRQIPFDAASYGRVRRTFLSKDGTRIPVSLIGRPEVLEGGPHASILTSYGGYGVSVAPQFSALAAFLLERHCLLALPSIRGGSEFGSAWHEAARRQNRQVAFDDFLSAAEWLVWSGRTTPRRLGIFGGSNAGLLVGVALTERPDLFRAAVCLVPILDMLRYHLFDHARFWKQEFGTAEDPSDFEALRAYSPYHAVRDETPYPATLIVSGDADQTCNAMHARKMIARLQAANTGSTPILLGYSKHRGHVPVLPLSARIEALTDRLAFLSEQLALPI